MKIWVIESMGHREAVSDLLTYRNLTLSLYVKILANYQGVGVI